MFILYVHSRYIDVAIGFKMYLSPHVRFSLNRSLFFNVSLPLHHFHLQANKLVMTYNTTIVSFACSDVQTIVFSRKALQVTLMSTKLSYIVYLNIPIVYDDMEAQMASGKLTNFS